jgi:hypothetical protein
MSARTFLSFLNFSKGQGFVLEVKGLCERRWH